MKSLKNFINEGFKLGKNKVSKITYNYFPKNKIELKEILQERLTKDKNADLNDIDISNIDKLNGLFMGLDPHNIDISKWDVSSVKDMYSMFYMCKSFEGIGLENWDVSNVVEMEWIFGGCDSIKKLPYWYKENKNI